MRLPLSLKRAARGLVPPRLRPSVRRIVAEAPNRFRDPVPDLRDRLFSLEPLPPASLRSRVGWSSSRREFLSVGRAAWKDLVAAIEAGGASMQDLSEWLDFGCGSGRVARHALSHRPTRLRLTGVDVDRDAVEWCRKNLLGRYQVIASGPPTQLPAGGFDVVYAISVFTHLSEPRQLARLEELCRLLRPGGLIVVSTHAPDLAWTRPDLTEAQRELLSREGQLFAPSGRGFNDDSAFHSEDYLRRIWGRLLELREFRSHGLGGYQDLSVWRKR